MPLNLCSSGGRERINRVLSMPVWDAQVYKIMPAELKVGSITDAIVCRIAASHC